MQRVLIVGAGAVGQVYGHFLQRGGAEVSYLVKPSHYEECVDGFTIYRCRRNGLGAGEHFVPVHVLTDIEDVALTVWDQVWLAVPSDALRSGWLPSLKKAIGDSTLVMLQPDMDDRDLVLQSFDESQVIYGMVNFLSYQTPLPGMPFHHPDVGKVGTAFLPIPMMAAEFSGNWERLPPVMEALSNGRYTARVQQNVPRIYADRAAMMMPLVALLEKEGWVINRMLNSPDLALAVDAANEALMVVAAKFHANRNLTERMFGVLWVRMVLPILRWLAPMDAESYLKYQFLKTRRQTRLMLQTFVDEGRAHNVPVESLQRWLRSLPYVADETPSSQEHVAA